MEAQRRCASLECRHPVQSGDAIWMAPYVPQWFAALGTGPSDYARYILYKDLSFSTLT